MHKSINTYLDLCTEVYELSKPTPPRDAYDFYRSYLTHAQGLILEPMCGSGRYLLEFVSEGFNIHGFDASISMLDALRKKAKARNIKIHVWQDLVENLQLTEKYTLIFIPSGSFGLLTDLTVAKNALTQFYNLLSDNGLLVFEIETLKAMSKQLNIWRGFAFPTQDQNIILANFLDLPIQNNIATTICRYELVNNNSIVKTEIENFKIRLYDPTHFDSLLTEVGFTKIKKLKAFDRNQPPHSDDEVIVYECRK